MGLTLELIQGTSGDYPLQAYNRDGTLATGVFQDSDSLTCKVWAGQDQQVIFNPGITWISSSAGTYQVTFNNADTSSWLPGNYRIQAYASRGGRTACIGNMNLSLAYAPGMAPVLSTYCSLQDILRYVRWIENLTVFKNDETGFLTQRNEARQWLENMGQRHYRLTAGLNLSLFSNPVPTWGPRRTGGYSNWLQQQFDANYLMTSPPRRVKEITAKYAAFLVLQDVISSSGTDKSFYMKKSDWLMNECSDLLKCMTLELDLNNDGYADVTIECALVDVLRGG